MHVLVITGLNIQHHCIYSKRKIDLLVRSSSCTGRMTAVDDFLPKQTANLNRSHRPIIFVTIRQQVNFLFLYSALGRRNGPVAGLLLRFVLLYYIFLTYLSVSQHGRVVTVNVILDVIREKCAGKSQFKWSNSFCIKWWITNKRVNINDLGWQSSKNVLIQGNVFQ